MNAEATSKFTHFLSSFSFSLFLNRQYAIVGAYGHEGYKGAAYLFEKQNSGEWTEVAKLRWGTSEQVFLGWSVSIHNKRAAVGAPGSSKIISPSFPIEKRMR